MYTIITIKKAIGTSPFDLVYASKVRLHVKNLLPIYKFVRENDLEMSDTLKERMEQFAKLDETGEDAHRKNMRLEQKRKYLFEKRESQRKFKVNDPVLLWNARAEEKGKHDEFEALWLGPYVVVEKNSEDSYFLMDMDGEMKELSVHGQFFKCFFS